MHESRPESPDTPVLVNCSIELSHLSTAQAISYRYIRHAATRHAWAWWTLNILAWALIALSLLLVFQALEALPAPQKGTARLGLGGLLLTTAGLAVAEAIRRRHNNRRILELHGPFPVAQQVIFSDAAIEFVSPRGEGRFPRESVATLVETPTALVLVLHSGFALPIPNAAFSSEAQRVAVLDLMRRMLAPA